MIIRKVSAAILALTLIQLPNPVFAAGESNPGNMLLSTNDFALNQGLTAINLIQKSSSSATMTTHIGVPLLDDQIPTAFDASLDNPHNLISNTILQSGLNNQVALRSSGKGNLFSAAQIGDNNQIAADITGNGNQTIISQSQNAFASVSQSGNGNMVSITQVSW